MVTDNVGDVGRHQNLLVEIPVMVLLTEDTGQCDRSQHQTAAQRPTSEGSPESRRSAALVRVNSWLMERRSSRRFEAKLRCEPLSKRRAQGRKLLQLGVFCLRLPENRDVEVRVFPECEKILVGS